ncbi:MAG: hypothetical protein AB1428_06030 [Bacteroidota bacterium]
MSENTTSKEPPQSGAKVAIGIISFVIGLFVLLWLIKMTAGF